ncbi:VTT domain-containing protein [Serpentinicella sp. ANB-PHB4]|uniref:TVP38/TMEM64 family protein n=1 Tax=Serpentinicella sp. ANB-PHB4 TaxID=3074076 RepID=UPI00285EA996|nr:VTT domain-containing protein [Serpentinicella sp. ANB-PHB4]MDR5659228.1 VTT domain-containing protein [Serpentinicella sp. ANB-PHB4]
MNIGSWQKKAAYFFICACIFVLLIQIKNNLNIDLYTIQSTVAGYGSLGIIVFIIIGSLKTLLLIPAPVIFIAGGLIFGTFFGTLYTLVSFTVSTVLVYRLSQRFTKFFSKFAKNKYREKLITMEEEQIIRTVFFMRIIPGIPYDILTVTAGIVGVDMRQFVIGTVLGILPKVILFGSIGNNANNIFSIKTLILYGVLILMVFGMYIVQKKFTRKLPSKI